MSSYSGLLTYPDMPRPQVIEDFPLDLKILTYIRMEGSKREGMCFSLPHKAHKALTLDGWDGTWLDFELPNGERFTAHARWSQTKYDVALPKRFHELTRVGAPLEVIVRDPGPEKVYSSEAFSEYGVDWAALAPPQVLPIQEGPDLILHSRYSPPFRMRRFTPWKDAAWLLGFYFAEGSKGEKAPDWSLSNHGSASLAEVVRLLPELGIARNRLYLEILHTLNQAPDQTVEKYEDLDVEVTSVRPRIGKGNDAGILHVRDSLNFLRMFKELYERLPAVLEKIPREACKDFAFGFLEGDGNITLPASHGTRLHFVGADETQSRLALHALNRGLEWNREYKNIKKMGGGDEQGWSIDAVKAAKLLLLNAFVRTSNHKSLRDGLTRQSETFRKLWAAFGNRLFRRSDAESITSYGRVNAMLLHSYVEEDDYGTLQFSEKGKELADLLGQLQMV